MTPGEVTEEQQVELNRQFYALVRNKTDRSPIILCDMPLSTLLTSTCQVDSVLLGFLSFLLFSVLLKPLVKIVRQRIWSSRILQIGALLAVLVLW